MAPFNRRSFLKKSSLGLLPAVIPFSAVLANDHHGKSPIPPSTPAIKLFGDGEMYEPTDYLNALQKANAANAIIPDRYGAGGAVAALEKKFVELTGKEKAIFMPSGTMANQLAISVLAGENSKIFVQDTSHMYRDEGDAAQTIFNKRLMPLAKDETYFTAEQLQAAIENLPNEEVFNAGIGAVAIENPVRRTNGKMVPLDEIKKISAYCRAKNLKLHLDGARIFMASAWSGVPIAEYAKHFDTVYISLYKYLGASGGAILCGEAAVIDKMVHLIKVHGGTMYGNWTNAAMALYKLEGFEGRLKNAITRSEEIFNELNKIPGFEFKKLSGGTNIYGLQLPKTVDAKKMQQKLNKDFNIKMPGANKDNYTFISINETLLYQNANDVIDAFKKSMQG